MGRYVDDEGREKTKSFARKIDAKGWVDDQSAALVTGTYVDPVRAAITFTEFYERWSPSQVWVHGTRQSMDQSAAAVTFGDVRMADLDTDHVQKWIRQMLDDGLAAGTIHTRFGNVRTVLRAAMRGRKRVLVFDPCEGVKLPKVTGRMRVPTVAEVKYLLESAPGEFRAAVALGAFAGARDGEIRGLKCSDIGFLEREVRIERQAGRAGVVPPKQDSVRTIAVSAGLTEIVAQHIAEHVPGSDPHRWLFQGRGDAPAAHSTMHAKWNTARAGLDWPMHLHDLRHFFASGLIVAGCDVKTVQHALGHKSATVTLNVYGHLWPDGSERTRQAGDQLMSAVAAADQLRTESG